MEDEDAVFVVLDGSDLNDLDVDLNPDGASAAAIADAVASAAMPALRGLALPPEVLSAALARLPESHHDATATLTPAEARARAHDLLAAVAAQLRDEPIAVSILDGRSIRVILEDEDDFAMLAEHLFTDLDVSDIGKLSKDEIRNALGRIGVDLGVPPFAEMDGILPGILKKHGAEGKEELGQAQFAQLLQTVLQDLADSLAKNPITVMQNIKIMNGSKLRKILADPDLFDATVTKMYEDWEDGKTEETNEKRLRALLDSRCRDLGLPCSDENQNLPVLYDQLLTAVKDEITSELTLDSFKEVVKFVLEKLGAQLEATPIFC